MAEDPVLDICEVSRVGVAMISMSSSWNLNVERVRNGCAALRDTYVALEEEEDRVFVHSPKEMEHAVLVAFMFAKGMASDMDVKHRVATFRMLVQGCSGSKAAQRLNRIVLEGEVGCRFGEPHPDSFTCFQDANPEWGPKRSYVTFRDHHLLKDKPHTFVERRQKSALCYVHAPVVLQHYVVAMQRKDAVPMINVAEFLRRHMEGKDLTERVLDNQGGDAKEFLVRILTRDSSTIESSIADARHMLETFGPGLVSAFRVDKEFLEGAEWRYTGRIGKEEGMHAMVLVGHRKEGNEIRFLIQNWWVQKPLVEVNQEYLFATKAKLYFVATPQMEIPWPFTTNSLDLIEWELPTSPESVEP
jgi:hypothetical protein